MLPTIPLRAACALRAASAAFTQPSTPLLPRVTRAALSTSAPAAYRQPRVPNSTIPIPSTTAPAPEIPPYPLPARQVYHQANTGLYGAASIRFGNKVSERNEIKTRRAWRPNVQHKRLWSAALACLVRTRVTPRVLRTIDKVGGLDAYLLGTKASRLRDLGPWGWRLRWRVMQAPATRARLNAERQQLGLPPMTDAELDEAAHTMPSSAPGARGKNRGNKAAREVKAAKAAREARQDKMVEETSRMLANGEEFPLGDEGDFMREETPPGLPKVDGKQAKS